MKKNWKSDRDNWAPLVPKFKPTQVSKPKKQAKPLPGQQSLFDDAREPKRRKR